MTSQSACRDGGRILADQLVLPGVDVVFAVPGESDLPVLIGLHSQSRMGFLSRQHSRACRQLT
jgi:thiamine pyrophosphate-dependent acetolactate synthase large subunit-like protein